MQNVFMEQTKRQHGKVRVFNVPGQNLKTLEREICEALFEFWPDLNQLNRISQSKNDISYYKTYAHVLHLDIRNALQSGRLILICLLLVILRPSLIGLVPKVLKLYLSSIKKKEGTFVRSYTLKTGLFSSALLLEITLRVPYSIIKKLMPIQIYVDDVCIYSQKRYALIIARMFLTNWCSLFGFKFHKHQYYNLSTRPKKAGERLGLEFGFRKGVLITRIRPRTLNRYLARFRAIARVRDYSWVIKVTQNIFYMKNNPKGFPLYLTFPASIWLCPVQRKILASKISFTLKKSLPELRSISNEELFRVLMGT